MKQLIASILLTITVASTANAGDRFNNLTKEYLYGKNSTVSIEVKRVIAKDSQTSSDTLKLLIDDKDQIVRSYARKNLAH